MLKLLENLPPHVIGVRATNEVTKDDIDLVLIPAMDELVNRTDHIYYLLLLETDIANWDIGAWLSDAKLGIRYFTKWTKIAVVSDQQGVNAFTDVFSAVVPGEAKGFPISQLEEAKRWLSVKES